ncbi:MAG: DUF3501 family protein [Gammaproteobacteria bacterium]
MSKLGREDLMNLEQYAEQRQAFREQVMLHKKHRQVAVSEHTTLYFEDQLTMQYQVQEMLRIERIFEADAIQEELDAYNPLIQDKVWVQVSGFDKVFANADEDLERDTEEKTSSVHFLRFQLEGDMVAAVKSGADINMGIDHEHCHCAVEPVSQDIRDSLARDLQ